MKTHPLPIRILARFQVAVIASGIDIRYSAKIGNSRYVTSLKQVSYKVLILLLVLAQQDGHEDVHSRVPGTCFIYYELLFFILYYCKVFDD